MYRLRTIFEEIYLTLRLLGMSWGVKTTCLEAPGVSLGGSGVSIGGVGSLREKKMTPQKKKTRRAHPRKPQRKFFFNWSCQAGQVAWFPGEGAVVGVINLGGGKPNP